MTAIEKLEAYAIATGQEFTIESFDVGVLVKLPATFDNGMQTGVGITFEEAVANLLRKFDGAI